MISQWGQCGFSPFWHHSCVCLNAANKENRVQRTGPHHRGGAMRRTVLSHAVSHSADPAHGMGDAAPATAHACAANSQSNHDQPTNPATKQSGNQASNLARDCNQPINKRPKQLIMQSTQIKRCHLSPNVSHRVNTLHEKEAVAQ